MGIISKFASVVTAAAGLATVSQAPEFAQQYRQRIGGAVEELKVVVADFDKDAASSNLSRNEALTKLQNSSEQFSRDRGASMGGTVKRFDALTLPRSNLESAHPLARPLFVLRNPDSKIISDAWKIFEPAVPLSVGGAIYGGIGALFGFGVARAGVSGVRRMRKRKSDTKLQNAVEETANNDEAALKAVQKAQSFLSDDAKELSQQDASHRGIPASMAVSPAARNAAQYYKARCDQLIDRETCDEENTSAQALRREQGS